MRDYGLANLKTVGPPRLGSSVDMECPACSGKTLFQIEIDVTDKLLKHGGIGVGRYIGCAACPWASPMVTEAVQPKDDH